MEKKNNNVDHTRGYDKKVITPKIDVSNQGKIKVVVNLPKGPPPSPKK
jgi:hypothetical protein